jgi:hypothetical protein
MALYSVWDWDRNSWAIYQTKTPVSVGDDPSPPQASGPARGLGADPDTGVKALPRGAKRIGYSHVARGEIRRRPRHLGDLGDDAGRRAAGGWGLPLALGVGIGVAVSRWWKRRG